MEHALFRKLLVRLLRIDSWHEGDYSGKEYAVYASHVVGKIVKDYEKEYANKHIQVVEIGCGLGDIIGNINYDTRFLMGLDCSKRIIIAAKILHPCITFKIGSFSNVDNEREICLILVNFLHFMNPQYVRKAIKDVLKRNRVKYVVMDELRNTEDSEYKYEYDGKELLGDKYFVRYCSKRIKAAHDAYRHVYVYECRD